VARKYQIKFAKGAPVDESFLEFADSLFTELGLSPELAQRAADRWQQYAGARMASEAAATQRELDAFRTEMGAGHDEAIAAGQKAALSLGLNGAALQAIERTLGTAPMGAGRDRPPAFRLRFPNQDENARSRQGSGRAALVWLA
jgi:hypothetical protein